MSKEKFHEEPNYETILSEIVEEAPEITSVSEEPTDVKVIGNTRLNLREEPRAGAAIVRVLLPHEKLVTIGNTDKEWIEVYTNNGEHGYVLSQFIVKVNEE